MDTEVGSWGWDELGDWDRCVYTADPTCEMVTNESKLLSVEKSTQWSAVSQMGRESKQRGMCEQTPASLRCPAVKPLDYNKKVATPTHKRAILVPRVKWVRMKIYSRKTQWQVLC